MDTVNTYFQSSVLPLFPNHGFYFFLCFLHHFFNTSRMNTTIHDQFFKSNSCHFTADRIKSGQNNSLRCIVNDQIYTGQCFQCTDISSFTTDDSSFHLIAWKLYNGNGRFCHMVNRTFLNGCYHIFFCFLCSIFFCFAFQFFVKFCSINFHFIFNRF